MNLFKKLFLTIVTSLSVFVVSSCNKEGFVDYASKSEARLALDYKDKSFLTDGIAKVSLETAIDGDTAHFKEEGVKETIKCRFYGVDTPESTGDIEPYGKAASNFTKEKLKKADKDGTIVISVPSDTYTKPSFDSTGSRYLALVWINEDVKNCDYKDLELLNLLLVQEGYSDVKNASQIERLEPIFREAWQQAQDLKLNMFSGEDDPLYNYGSYEPVSLLDMKIELEKQIAAQAKGEEYKNKYDNKNVKVVGTVVGYANRIIYLQNYYSVENGGRFGYGEYAGINIYTGMGSISSKFYKKNTYLQICGTAVDSENFGFQISGCSFKEYNPKENDAQVIIPPKDNTDEYKMYTFEKSVKDIKQNDYEILNSPVEFTDEVKVTGGYDSTTSNEITLYVATKEGEELDFNVYLSFIYKPDESNPSLAWNSYTYFVDKLFTLQGVLALHKTKKGNYKVQILPTTSSDLSLVGGYEG